MNDVPRRNRMDQWTAAERAIFDAVQAVEAMAADVRLTDAVVLLQAARDSVADCVDNLWPRRRYVGQGSPQPLQQLATFVTERGQIVHTPEGAKISHDGFNNQCPLCVEQVLAFVRAAPVTRRTVYPCRKLSTDELSLATFKGDTLASMDRAEAVRLAYDILDLFEALPAHPVPPAEGEK